jgi:signal transduction histidine kinase/ligand-binding sensor domain-containing protein
MTKMMSVVNLKKVSRLMYTTVCFTFFSLILLPCTYGQRNYLFENISVAEGLSNLEIHTIFQDKFGFLWISTANGLNRYDGVNMVVFKNDPGDSTSLPNNNCFAITEDSEGFLWIGVSGNTIAKYNPVNEKFLKYPIETGNVNITSTFYTAITDQNGDVWFGSSNHGIQKYNRSENKFEKIDLDSTNSSNQWGEILGLTQLKNGSIIAADYGNGIKIYNEKLNSFQPFYLNGNYSPASIIVMYEDLSGNIWFGGLSKLIKYSPSLASIKDYNIAGLFKTPTTYDNMMGIVEDEEGYIWAGVYSQGLYRIDPEKKNIQRFDYAEDYGELAANPIIQQIFKDKYNVIWIGTLRRGLYKFDPLREPFTFSKIKSDRLVNSDVNRVNVIAGSPQTKKILVGTSNDGLFEYDLESKKSTPLNIRFDPLTIPDGRINIKCLAIDHEGNKWFTYNNLGLHKIDKNNSLSVFNSPFFKATTTYVANTLKIDYSVNIWIASRYGYEKFDPTKMQFTMLPTLLNKQMSKNLKEQIDQIPQTREPIASILKVGEATSLEKKFSLSHDQKVLIIGLGEGQLSGQGIDDLSDRGSLFTGDGKLIWSMNDLSKTFNDGGGFKNRIAVKCLGLTKGDYKITYATDVGHSFGTWNVAPPPDSLWYGIQILGINDSEYENIKALNEKEIISDKFMPMEIGTSIEFSKQNRNIVWLGTAMSSFFKYDLTTGNFKQYNLDTNNKFSPNNTIASMMEDTEGIVWIATLGSLLRFDPSTEKVEKFDKRDGLPSNQVNSIIEDIQGNLWVNTSGGMAKLNKDAPRDKWNFIGFDAKDGLQESTSSSATWTGGDGIIVVGGSDGITSFYPGKINEVKPEIVMIDIKVSDVSLKSDSTVMKLKKSIMETEELSLSYFENNLSFEFASIHFSRPEKNKLLYKLDGFNDRWIVADRNFATFTNLAPGEYTFSVKGSNGDGIWNDAGKSIRIIISPPLWKTWWAYGFYILFFVVGVFGIDRFMRNRLILKEKERSRAFKLEQAKKIEKAYNELKSTQSQLIQSEKMASLGELTAGIAHEIQNPLNFVNNFSEVNKELLVELKDEINNGNFDEVNAIANDLISNEEKIIHHGKRADAIVKGMLQHSRSSSGVKEPTDINALADEYLRLAYHGLRAKDKSFNATMKTDFDESIHSINIIPQDIGRVILNLITNAFYAVTEKKNSANPSLLEQKYEPTVTLRTKKINTRPDDPVGREKIEISVRDNGNGIPQKVLDKIFQPFFTTKPTGQGTGLGLSMSYDIITNGHGGELKVNTREGEYAEFIIILNA